MGTRYRGTNREVIALDAYIKLMRAAESVTARRAPLFAEAGLTVTQFGALEALYHLGPMLPSELGRKLLKSSGNLTLVVDNLERRKLVRRERSGDDRRRVTVHLTPGGRRLISRIFPGHVKAIVEEMGTLNQSEQKTLGRLCRRLGLKQKGRRAS
ncbi:MAG TPA: MarR family transcriptional regulator [Candidatus Polarisedimenticolia bacterium]|nr:MarR family transcriptional regulator [Candidatus Polarisedimenticolia bacterium]